MGVNVIVGVLVFVSVDVAVFVLVSTMVGVLLGRGVKVGWSGPAVAVFVDVLVGTVAVAVGVLDGAAVTAEVAVAVYEPDPEP